MSDDLDTELDEFEEDEDGEAGTDGGNPLRGVVRKLERKLKRMEKDHQKALDEAKNQAIEDYKVSQQKVAQAKEVFGGLGYEGFAQDFLALHPDTAEVAPDAAKEWLTARGLEVKGDSEETPKPEPQPQQQTPSVNRLHQAGSSGAPNPRRYTQEELRQLVRENPQEARRVVQEGLVDHGVKSGSDWWKPPDK